VTTPNPALAAAAAEDELTIASRRADGSLRPERIIWAVEHDGALYVRSVNGPRAAWYRGTRTRHEGQLTADRRYAANILDHITGTPARSTTTRLVPASSTKD
jgi:hypothetical protein